MKIGIVCNAFAQSGGMETYTLGLVRSFARLGADRPVVFSTRFDPNRPEYQLIEPVSIPAWFVPQKLRPRYVAARVEKLRSRFGVDVLIACCRCPGAEIVACGGTHPGFCEALGRMKRSDRGTIAFERRMYERARFTVAHSRLMAREVERFYGVPEDRIRVLYPPVSSERFKPLGKESRAALRRELGIPEDRTAFLFVSSSHERKGLPLLLPFFESTALPVELIVAGRPLKLPPGYTGPRVHYIGYRKDIEKVYGACDFSILASVYEPFGLAPVESLFCGTPVVIAENLGAAEILPRSCCETFRRGDAASLSLAVERAVARRVEMKEAALGIDPASLLPGPDEHARAILGLAREISRS